MTAPEPTAEQRAQHVVSVYVEHASSLLRQRYNDLVLTWEPGDELPRDAADYLADQLRGIFFAAYAAGHAAALEGAEVEWAVESPGLAGVIAFPRLSEHEARALFAQSNHYRLLSRTVLPWREVTE